MIQSLNAHQGTTAHSVPNLHLQQMVSLEMFAQKVHIALKAAQPQSFAKKALMQTRLGSQSVHHAGPVNIALVVGYPLRLDRVQLVTSVRLVPTQKLQSKGCAQCCTCVLKGPNYLKPAILVRTSSTKVKARAIRARLDSIVIANSIRS